MNKIFHSLLRTITIRHLVLLSTILVMIGIIYSSTQITQNGTFSSFNTKAATNTLQPAVQPVIGKIGIGSTAPIALLLDGKSGLGIGDSFNALSLKNAFTLEAWVNILAPTHSYNYIFAHNITPGSTPTIADLSSGYNVYINAGIGATPLSSTVSAALVANVGQQQVQASNKIPFNTWTHIAVTSNLTTMNLFVNGSLVGTSNIVRGTINTTKFMNSFIGYIDSISDPRGGGFYGRIDDLRISNVIRDVPTLWKNGTYNSGLRTDSSTAALWHFENNYTNDGTALFVMRSMSSTVTFGPGRVGLPAPVISPTLVPTATPIIKPTGIPPKPTVPPLPISCGCKAGVVVYNNCQSKSFAFCNALGACLCMSATPMP